MSGKTIKTDKLDAKFLAGLHPSDHVPTVYIPTLEEEGRRDAEREWDRIKKSIDRVNAQMIALIERTPLPGFKSHRTACEWQKAIRKWSKLPEWAECPSLLLLRLPNLLAELELFEKELSAWKQTIQQFQDHDEETSKQKGNTDSTAETVRKLQQFKGVGDRLSTLALGDRRVSSFCHRKTICRIFRIGTMSICQRNNEKRSGYQQSRTQKSAKNGD